MSGDPGAAPDDLWPAAPPGRQPTRGGVVATHVVGAVACVGALVFALIADAVLLFLTSYSGDAPSAGQRRTVTLGLLVVGGVVSAVPAFTAMMARRMESVAWPWFVLAAITTLYMFGVALSSHPIPGNTTLTFFAARPGAGAAPSDLARPHPVYRSAGIGTV